MICLLRICTVLSKQLEGIKRIQFRSFHIHTFFIINFRRLNHRMMIPFFFRKLWGNSIYPFKKFPVPDQFSPKPQNRLQDSSHSRYDRNRVYRIKIGFHRLQRTYHDLSFCSAFKTGFYITEQVPGIGEGLCFKEILLQRIFIILKHQCKKFQSRGYVNRTSPTVVCPAVRFSVSVQPINSFRL